MSSPTDASHEHALIDGLRMGRLEVFRQIFEDYAMRLQRFAQLWVGADVAEDLVQDVLFDLWRRRDTLQVQNGNLTAYLFSAVRNRVGMYARHEHVSNRLTTANDDDVVSPGMGTSPVAPDEQVILDDFHVAMKAVMTQLSPLQRAVLLLRWTQGLSYGDIGTALSISENAARHHMSRLRQVLRPLLSDYIGPLE